MKRPIAIVTALLAASISSAALATPEPVKLSGELEQLRIKALAGDYSSQRNLAYTYATGGGLQGKKYPVAACAWYLALPQFNAAKIHAGDAGNVKVYCGALELEDLRTAMTYSAELVSKHKR